MNRLSMKAQSIHQAFNQSFAIMKHSRKLFIILIAALLVGIHSPKQVHAAAGDLDPTFGMGGKVATESGFGRAMVIQPDGKILVAGGTIGTPDMFSDFRLLRYNTDGTPDSTFGAGGKVTTDLGSADYATAVALQPDGKIVVAGISFFLGQNFALVRYNNDGSIDSSFGSNGKVSTDFFGFADLANAIAIKSNGKILVAGRAGRNLQFPPLSDFAIAQYNSDGTLDLTFGTGGKTVTDFRGASDVAYAMVVQADGKIVLAGSNEIFHNFPSILDFALARYDSNGNLDTSFGVNGKVTTEFFGSFDEAYALALQSDGKIIAAGVATNNNAVSTSDFALVRYHPDGSLDSSFGTAGKTLTDFSSESDSVNGISIQRDGKIVAAGVKEVGSGSHPSTDWALARYSQAGILDPTFGSGGKTSTDLLQYDDYVGAMALQNDGKIVVVGRANYPVSPSQIGAKFALARYKGDGNFDTCLQDDSSGDALQFNSTSGEYQFTRCGGITLGGTGTVTNRGCTITLQHNAADRRIMARLDSCQNQGTASVQLFSPGTTISILDRNSANNTCACP